MKKKGVPITRANYLDFAYFGSPPEVLDAEEEAELPKELQETQEEPEETASEPERNYIEEFQKSIANS
jgi:hypothetical protein